MWLNNVINTVINTVIDERARVVEDGEIVEPLVSRPLIFLLDESKGD